MVSMDVQRVLVEYDRITRALVALEESERTELAQLQAVPAPLRPDEGEERVRAEQFALGRVEGLVQAQLALCGLRETFSRRYRPSAAGWQRSE